MQFPYWLAVEAGHEQGPFNCAKCGEPDRLRPDAQPIAYPGPGSKVPLGALCQGCYREALKWRVRERKETDVVQS